MNYTKSYDDYQKSDWLKHNTDPQISDDEYIYRIFNVDYLLDDLKNQKMTLVLPCEKTQKDNLENPLKNTNFNFEGQKHQLFKELMSTYYSQSWSNIPIENWNYFGGGNNTIRVKCKASLLFERLMNVQDKYYNLYYHMWKIQYEDEVKIIANLANKGFEEFLDSNGDGLMRTIMTLNTDFYKEDKIRIVYNQSPHADNTFPNQNKVFGDDNQYCSHIYDWQNVIEDYTLNPNYNGDCKEIIKVIEKYKS